jgi:phage tail-like protein
MDANGTRYHLLLGPRDWPARLEGSTLPEEERLQWDPRRGTVTLRRKLFRLPPRSSESPLDPEDRRGADRDRFGHFYWIGPDRTTICYRAAAGRRGALLWSVDELAAEPCPPDDGSFGPEAPPEVPELPTLWGLAVTDRLYLVVGTRDPGGLLVFDLHGGGPPVWLLWPDAVPFAPFDLATAPGGGLWILERPSAGGPRLWRLDRDLRVVQVGGSIELEAAVTDDFKPVGGEPREQPARIFPAAITPALASPLEAADAVALTVLPDDSVVVLEPDPPAGTTRVHRLQDGIAGEPISLREVVGDLLGEAELVGHDLAFVPSPEPPGPGEVAGTLYVVSDEGNQSYAFNLAADVDGTFELTALDAYLPMRRFAGKALVEGGGEVFYDHVVPTGDEGNGDGAGGHDSLWLRLGEVPRPLFGFRGRVDGLVFDGKEPGCIWHRLFLDACIPPGDGVTVESRAADDPDALEEVPWRTEPRPGLRPGGSELPWIDADGSSFASSRTRRPGEGTWELLFQGTVGRWLELRLTFTGSGRSSPRLRALRVHYPRFSYVDRYLPAIYRQDPSSASFLDRFVANFEGFFTEVEGRIAEVQTLFDHRTVPDDALEWLAGWLGAVLDPTWDKFRRRLFLAHAAELYRRRGTPRGLLQAVRLAVDPCPDEGLFTDDSSTGSGGGGTPFTVRLVEAFRARQLPSVVLGDATAVTAPALIRDDEPWVPTQGGARLHQLYRDFLTRHQPEEPEPETFLFRVIGAVAEAPQTVAFPPRPPQDAEELTLWRAFVRFKLAFPYAEVTEDDVTGWRAHLSRRYRRIEALHQSWKLTGSARPASFDQIELPQQLPPDGAPLVDWFQFASLALPMSRNAHRFSVLVPVAPGLAAEERQRRLAQVETVVELEKPAHTDFEVRLYWALFRIGTARVGLDTALGEGSRLTAISLGAGYLGEGLLAEEYPENRRIVGRDPVGGPPPLG